MRSFFGNLQICDSRLPNHCISLRFRKEFAAAAARPSKTVENRCALGWAPGPPKAKFLKAVSGSLGFPLVSLGIRCKAHKNLKKSLLGPFFSTARPPAGFLSFYLINWIAPIFNLNIVDFLQKPRQKSGSIFGNLQICDASFAKPLHFL